MENTSYVALSRQTTLWKQLDVVANNLANVNTTAYRGKSMVFTDYVTKTPNDDSAFSEEVNFVQDYGIAEDLKEGPLKETNNQMDLAINGPGYFALEGADGSEMYTRAGAFLLDADGKVVNSSGNALLSEQGTPLFIAPNEGRFDVAQDGTVSTENGVVGRLKIVNFDDEQALVNIGNNLYDARPEQEVKTVDNPNVVQGMLEGSNVNGILEVTKLIDLQRSYNNVNMLIKSEDDRVTDTMTAWSKQV